jgi:predicted amidohydrolase
MAGFTIGIHQAEPGSGITDLERDRYRQAGVRVLVLPEYFWVRPQDRDHRNSAGHAVEDLELMARWSTEDGWVLVGGTFVEHHEGEVFYNTCPVFHQGHEIGRYRKIHLMPGEARHGLHPGAGFLLFEALGLRMAPVICADVLYPDTFSAVAALRPDLILAPMSSPHLPGDTPEAKDKRDREIFLRGAARAGAPIVKAGSVGHLFQRPLQGRSLVATPGTLLFRTPFDQEHTRHTWIIDVPLSPRRRALAERRVQPNDLSG